MTEYFPNYYDSQNTLQNVRVESRDGVKVLHFADDVEISSDDLDKELVYYSKYLFKTSGGTWKEKPTLDSDVINLDTDGINILLYELAELVTQELQGESMVQDLNYFSSKKKEAWDTYERSHKSIAYKRQNNYYRPANLRRR